MPTPNDVNTQPSSGLNHIDALLDEGPGWNWLTPTRTTLYYTFSLTGVDAGVSGLITGSASAFNAAQQAAVTSLLNYVGSVTGITFTLTADASQADLHFADANITNASNPGVCRWTWSYSSNFQTITSYTAEAYVLVDSAGFAFAGNPTLGNGGHELLLHEIGHALGLKHPHEEGIVLPGAQDNTGNTLMSYNDLGGPYGAYRPFDIAALMFLYGGDGLGGTYGQGGGRYIIGTDAAETFNGSVLGDVFEGKGGNDIFSGADGSDTVRYNGLASAYTITKQGGVIVITGPEGTDTLSGIEYAQFTNALVQLESTPSNSVHTGTVAITGTLAQGATLSVESTLADLDGLGTLAYKWQASTDGTTWADLAGATGATLVLGQSTVGFKLRVAVSYTDGKGNAESETSAATSTAVANVNDPPVGGVTIAGVAERGGVLTATASITDADGLGTLMYRWQVQSGPLWQDVSRFNTNGNSFTLTDAEVGKAVRVQVDYVDGYGMVESVLSAPTAPVTGVNRAPTGSPAISGTPTQGQALTASAGTLADADGLGTLSHQWQAQVAANTWADVAGATGASFTPGEAQVGLRLRVLVKYTDGLGTAESVASAETAAVANVNDAPTGSVQVSGTAAIGQALTANVALADADGLGGFSYQWQSSANGSSWTSITGATAASFIPAAAQVGLQLRVLVQYTDGHGTTESVPSAATAAVPGAAAGTAGNDVLIGTSAADTLDGLGGNDRLTGAGGSDTLVGGTGLDTAVYTLARAQYAVGLKGAKVTALSGTEGADTLSGIERLQFADGGLAFDLEAAAGTVARYIGAVFGPASVGNPVYAGIGLQLSDGGMDNTALMRLALEARLGTGFSVASEVDLLYRNLTGSGPSAADLAFWQAQVAAGAYTPESLAQMAASLELNASNIGLSGLVDSGLAYQLPG